MAKFFRGTSFLACLLLLIFQSAPAEDRPVKSCVNCNVILIFVDALRADHLSCYGYPRKTSPNIDRLAEEAVVFEENFATAPYTLASFMSVITSLYPGSHGVVDISKDRLSSKVNTLPRILQMYGYKTAWFGPLGNIHLDPEAGFGRGFDELHDIADAHRLNELREGIFGWLDKNKNKKFFLSFHAANVLSPYFPDPKYKQKFTGITGMKGIAENEEQYEWGALKRIAKDGAQDKKLVDEIMGGGLFDQFLNSGLSGGSKEQIESFFISRNARHKLSTIRNHFYWRDIDLGDPSVNAYMQALYDADILELDDVLIGPLIGRLRAAGLYDKTIIIIFADHGEEFYEHGSYSHGKSLYDEVTHVPLVIRDPLAKRGVRVKELTQNVDIMPTILDLLGIPAPHQAQGKSLAGFIDGERPLPFRKYVFGKKHDLSSIRSKNWLLVLHDDNPQNKELYDLCSDPNQQENVYLENKKTASGLESCLKEWEASLPLYKDREYLFPPEIDKTTQERIRKTGYW